MADPLFFHHETVQIDGIGLGIGAIWQGHALLYSSLSPDRSVALQGGLETLQVSTPTCQPFPESLAQQFHMALLGEPVTWSWIASPRHGTPFQTRIWRALEQIEAGQRITYSQLAATVGSPGAARAAGNACSRNPLPLRIPCHRVVAANGKLGGFTGDLRVKDCLLAREATANSVQHPLHS